MLGSKKSAPKPVVRLKSVVQPKRPLLLKKSETPLDISKVLSSSAAKRPSNSREEREMDRIMVEHEFSADTPKFVTSSIPSRKRKAFVFDSDSDSLSDDDIQVTLLIYNSLTLFSRELTITTILTKK